MTETQKTLTDKCSFYLNSQGISHSISNMGKIRVIHLENLADDNDNKIDGVITVDDTTLILQVYLGCSVPVEKMHEALFMINAVNNMLLRGYLTYDPLAEKVEYCAKSMVEGCEIEDENFFHMFLGVIQVEITRLNLAFGAFAEGRADMEECIAMFRP